MDNDRAVDQPVTTHCMLNYSRLHAPRVPCPRLDLNCHFLIPFHQTLSNDHEVVLNKLAVFRDLPFQSNIASEESSVRHGKLQLPTGLFQQESEFNFLVPSRSIWAQMMHLRCSKADATGDRTLVSL
nr:hypothetical protein CFP56_60685 [Quercus suber]